MAKIVEADRPEAGALEQWLERTPGEVALSKGPSSGIGEDPSCRMWDRSETVAVCPKGLDGEGREVYATPTSCRLRLPDLEVPIHV
jgi:hypothetical protein